MRLAHSGGAAGYDDHEEGQRTWRFVWREARFVAGEAQLQLLVLARPDHRVVLAVIGAFFVSVALGAVGVILGVVGYALGARRLGVITAVLGVVSIFVGLLVGQGVMAGSYDRAVDGWFRNTPSEQITDE